MLTPAIRIKEKLSSGEPVVGIMATDHVWPLLVEICKQGGLDYLIIDREHGCHTDEVVAQVCQTARLADFPVLMRVVSCETSEIRRAMDMGPSGLLLPCVENTDQLDMARDAMLMPPRGKRRPGGMGNYWLKDFNYTTWRDDFEDHFIVIPQIENRRGVENAEAIAKHPLVTAMGIGPYDLSVDLGCCWDPDNAEHRESLAKIRAVADAEGKKVWEHYDGSTSRVQGRNFIWIGTVSGLLRNGFAASVNAIKNSTATKPGSQSPPA